MMSSVRIINIIFFFLLSISVTLYLYNQAFVSENNVFVLQSNELVGKIITEEVENNLKSLTTSIYGNSNSNVALSKDIPSTPVAIASKPIRINEAEFQIKLKTLATRINETLTWASRLDTSDSSPLQWDKMAVADLHILRKLLKYIMYQPNLTLESIQKGHQCNEVQKNQQLAISKYISMDICSEIEWYKLAHLTYPDAKLIFDVGGNKGYLGSLFVGLWGGGGYKLNPALLYQQAMKSGVWKGSRNPAGYCRDGLNYAMPLSCHIQPSSILSSDMNMPQIMTSLGRDEATGQCVNYHDDVKVHSFDGSSYLQACVQSLTKAVAVGEPKVLTTWTYHHNALSDTVGTVRFTKQGASQSPGFEGGRIQSNPKVETEEVNMTSIDTILRTWNLEGKLDILKIDTEGNDNKVITGAMNALKSSISLLTFEGGGGVTFSKAMSDELDAIGFSCYSTSRAGLFKWNGNCMIDNYFGTVRNKDKGNIFCVSRMRAPLMAMAYDALSFPLLITANYDRLDVTAEEKVSMEKDAFAKAFVHIKKFCNPWPSCILQ